MSFVKRTRASAIAFMITAISATGAFAADKVTVETKKAIPASEVPADATIVGINRMKYEQPELTIKAGETVYWVNKEVMPHNVAFKRGIAAEKAVQGVMLKKDEAWAATFNEAGTFDYHCTPHPAMRAKVIVE